MSVIESTRSIHRLCKNIDHKAVEFIALIWTIVQEICLKAMSVSFRIAPHKYDAFDAAIAARKPFISDSFITGT